MPICKTEVVVTVYCMAAPENFASQGEEVRHSITIAINEGSGSGKLVIPNGYEDGTVTLVGYEGMDGLEYGDLSMFTSVSSYGTSGWVGATGKGGPIQDCAGVPYALSGSFTARLNFEATGIDDTEMARVPTLHFIITDKDGNSNYYRLEIHFESIKRHKVEFYAPNYDSGILNDLRTNWMTTVIPPLFTLESSSTVNHGDRLASTDYPVTYEYFQGWYLNPECTKYFDTTSEITDDLKLYGGYSFKAIFHLYGETYETYNKEIVSGSVAMLEALYEDETVSVQTTYHYKSGGGDATYTETRHLGQTYVLPGPGGLSPAGDASDFKGWLLNGKVYDAGETFTVYSSKADLYAVYSDESAEATVFFAETAGDEADVLDSVTCYIGYVFEPLPPYMGQKSGEFRGWVCDGALYEPGERFVVSKEETVLYALFYDQSQGYHLVTGEEVVAHPGSKIHLPIPAYNIEKFRGWLVGGAFYYLYGSSDLTVTVPDGSVGYQPIYASDAIVSLTFSGGSDQPIQISRNNGDSLRVPAPDDMEGFVGWYSMGRVYQPGDLFVAMTDQATSDSVEFIALYNDEGSSSNATLLRAERLEFLCDNPYQAGDEVWVPTGTSWDAYNPGSVDTEYVMAADQREDFRGWKVGQAYYLLEDRASAYVVTRSDEVAVPVYETDDLPAVLLFDDGNSAVTGSYGSMVYLPEPTVPEDFVGWYSKGYVFPAGYRYVITDELTEFTAMHYGPNNTDSHILETPDPEMLYILHGNVYTYAEAKELYVPDSIDEWDGYFDEFDEHGNPVPDYDVTVRVYFGNSMNDMLVNPGQKDVVLPDPAYKEGFKGWLAGGVLYEPDENGVCKYTVQELYSYMHPIDVSEIALSNPGHHLEPDRKWWYDDDENLRFYVEDPETGIVDDIDHIVDDTVFHLNWIGNTLNIIPLVDSGSGYESLGADYEFEAVYGGQYGRPVVIATEKARELLGQNGHLAWMIAKYEEGSYVSTGEEVFETSTVFLDNYRSVVEPGDIDTLYIMAVLSVDSIRVKLYPGGTYIPLDSSTVTFEAMFEPVDMGSGATYAAVFDIDADGFDADDVEIQTCYGGSVALPMPDTLTGFVGWTRSIPGGDPAVYTGEYVFSDTNSVDQSGKAYFTPVYVDRSVACEAVFNVDITKGKMVDWPESSSKTVAAYKGQTVGLPDVKAENGFVFAGWMENGKIVKGDVIVVADTVLTASFAPAGSENATLVFNCDSGKGYCATSSLSAAVGNETTLPSVAPLDGYKFTGWKIVSDGRPAQESGFINLPTEFDVASDETGTSFDIVFREGYRTGHYLSGWKFSQYVDGVLREHVYTMRETPTVTKTGNTYSMSCDTGGPFEVTGFIEFEAIWTPISYVIEIQAPSEGAIRYRLPGSSEVFEVTKESGTASITAKYGDDIEMEYIPQLGSPYSFNRWTIVGEGDIIRDGMRGSLYVTGDASVGIALKQTFGYILTVYQPATGKGKVISDAGTPLEDSGTDHVNYRIIGGTPVTLHYITETDDTIHLWGVQNALKPDEDGSVEFTISGNTIAMPYLELRGMTVMEDVYAAFPENTEGVYSIPISSLGSVSAIAQAPDDMVATWDADDQVLVLTGAADVRGYVTVDVTVDDPIVASEFKVHVFIVGPLADGGLKTLL
ncbi:MAG: InlB B-repeat-containing protein [Candidatus Methanomethylophilaceae archaeon]|nr:InlB B-repeat-containing protein [Candidatus Methanomethylophilaceae archaeon]